MNNFNFNRFKNYGLYDLTINKKFYRSMALTIVLVLIGIAITGFYIRWFEWKTINTGTLLDSALAAHKLSASGTEGMMLAAISIMLIVLAGYVFHNLRTRQGRINELTLPATMLEKFTWHITANIFGGLLLCVAGILAADLINEVLTLIILPSEAQQSLTVGIINQATMHSFRATSEYMSVASTAPIHTDIYLNGFILFVICNFLMQASFYVYGNSVKYHYNIILTYAILQVATIILMMVVAGVISSIAMHISFCISPETTPLIVKTLLFGCCVLQVIVAALFTWRAYVRYSHAVVTSKMNK